MDEDVEAAYGFDHTIGFFVEIRSDGKAVSAYDSSRPDYRHLQGALDFFVNAGFFTRLDVADAHQWLRFLTYEEIADPKTKRAAEVITNLRRGAAL